MLQLILVLDIFSSLAGLILAIKISVEKFQYNYEILSNNFVNLDVA